MDSRKWMIAGFAGLIAVGGIFIWWGLHKNTELARASHAIKHHTQSTRHVPRRSSTLSKKSSSPSRHIPANMPVSSYAAHLTAQPLGTVAWSRQMRAILSHQWGHAAPRLWIAPNPGQAHTWFVLAPLAHQGRLWWTYATPHHPLPGFTSVPASLHMTSSQIHALPVAMQGALTQAYDLMHDQPWALTVHEPALSGSGAETATQIEANGKTSAPVAWQVLWLPAIPSAVPPQPAQTAFMIIQPWQSQNGGAFPPVLISSYMAQTVKNHLISSGIVHTLMNGQTMQPLSVQDHTALEPTSTATGISGP